MSALSQHYRRWFLVSAVVGCAISTACAAGARDVSVAKSQASGAADAKHSAPCAGGGLTLTPVGDFNRFIAAAADDPSDDDAIHIAMRVDRPFSDALYEANLQQLEQFCRALRETAADVAITLHPVAPKGQRIPNMSPPFVPNWRARVGTEADRRAARDLIGRDDFDITPIPIGWVTVLKGSDWHGRPPRFMPREHASSIIAAMTARKEASR